MYVETDRTDGVLLIQMNRPERLNALGQELRAELVAAWEEFQQSPDLEVAILTGTGRAFCAGGDMREQVERGAITHTHDPYHEGEVTKPVIAAVNGLAMGGGFVFVDQSGLRVAVPGVSIEMSAAKRYLLGGYSFGYTANLPHAAATELALAFRLTTDRLYQLGYINRLVEPDELLPTAYAMAEHLLSLPPASRVNTLAMMRALRPAVGEEFLALADRLRDHGAKDDLMESRRAFAEKRQPQWKGWDHPGDRDRTPTLERLRLEQSS